MFIFFLLKSPEGPNLTAVGTEEFV